MGGYGSGTRSDSRDTTDAYREVDIRFMLRRDCLKAYAMEQLFWSREGVQVASVNYVTASDRITLRYSASSRGREAEHFEYPVFIDRTRCLYGGTRAWFLCPARGCGKRVATLFGGRIFACRKCYDLAYPSQRESLSGMGSLLDDQGYGGGDRCGGGGGDDVDRVGAGGGERGCGRGRGGIGGGPAAAAAEEGGGRGEGEE